MSRLQLGAFWKLTLQVSLWRKQQQYTQNPERPWVLNFINIWNLTKFWCFCCHHCLFLFFNKKSFSIFEMYTFNLKKIQKYILKINKGRKKKTSNYLRLSKLIWINLYLLYVYFDNHIDIFDWIYNMLYLIMMWLIILQLLVLIIKEPWAVDFTLGCTELICFTQLYPGCLWSFVAISLGNDKNRTTLKISGFL